MARLETPAATLINTEKSLASALIQAHAAFASAKAQNIRFLALAISHFTIADSFITHGEDELFDLLKTRGIAAAQQDKVFAGQVAPFVMQNFHKHGGDFVRALYERTLVFHYQAFEIFIADCLTSLYWHCPCFLEGKTPPILNDLFCSDDILEIREKVIEGAVRDIIQGKNIVDAIEKAQNSFKVEIPLSRELKADLLLISNKRHLLIHNGGLINHTYQRRLRELQLDSREPLGQRLSISMDIVLAALDRLDEAAEIVAAALLKDVQRILTHAEAKKTVGRVR